jgi:hypothetical protein
MIGLGRSSTRTSRDSIGEWGTFLNFMGYPVVALVLAVLIAVFVRVAPEVWREGVGSGWRLAAILGACAVGVADFARRARGRAKATRRLRIAPVDTYREAAAAQMVLDASDDAARADEEPSCAPDEARGRHES